MSSLVLSQLMFDAIVAHAREESPRECCGIIAGKNGQATRFYRMVNVEAGNRLYVMDADELYAVTREIDQRGEDVMVIYHSHPVTPAYPSQTDSDYAFWPDSVYVICSLADQENPVVRAFMIADETIAEMLVEIG